MTASVFKLLGSHCILISCVFDTCLNLIFQPDTEIYIVYPNKTAKNVLLLLVIYLLIFSEIQSSKLFFFKFQYYDPTLGKYFNLCILFKLHLPPAFPGFYLFLN